jgi:pimeloyl-ACP methyl ester carboxylesterase
MSSRNRQIEQVMFRSGDVRCAANLYLPHDIQQTTLVPGLVLGHSGGNVKEALTDPARYLAEAGFAVLAIDYRTYGASEGEPRGQLFPEKQVEDFRNGVSYLQTRPEVDSNKIGVWGVAIGASVAIQAAVVDRRIKCVVAQTPDLLNGWRQILEGGGRERFGKLSTALEQDWQRRFETGESAHVPWPNFEDEVTQSYVNQAMEIYPTYRPRSPLNRSSTCWCGHRRTSSNISLQRHCCLSPLVGTTRTTRSTMFRSPIVERASPSGLKSCPTML